jgi:hypothetical protein
MSSAVPHLSLEAKASLPQHVAIIMDGNGRWAKQRGLPRIEGHRGTERSKVVHRLGLVRAATRRSLFDPGCLGGQSDAWQHCSRFDVVVNLKLNKLIRYFAVVISVTVFVAIFLASAICHFYGEMRGLLLDAKTGKPIEGAAVVGAFYIEHGTVGGQVEEFVDAKETTTDAEGRFLLPGTFVWAPRFPSLGKPISQFSKQPRIHVFAPGYESVDAWRGQAYSSVDSTNVPLGTNALGISIYRTEARPIITVASKTQGRIYEFRVCCLETDAAREENANTAFARGPAAKFPNYLKLFNAERQKYGLPEWEGWDP